MKKVLTVFAVCVIVLVLGFSVGCKKAATSNPTPEPTPVPTVVLEDFATADLGTNAFNGAWFGYSKFDTNKTDDPYGFGVLAPGYDFTGYAAYLTATVGTVLGAYGVWFGCNVSSTASANISQYTGIKFYVKESGGANCKISVLSDLTSKNYQYTFTTTSNWALVTVPFSSLTQETTDSVTINDVLGTATRILWSNGTKPQTLYLYLDQIVLY